MKKASLFLTLGLLLGLPLSAGAHPKAGATVRVKAAPRAAAAKPKAPVRPVNLNTATLTELLQLPKVGVKTAERIVSWRKEHGGFRRPEELMHVKGIGEKGYQRLKPYLQASAPAPTATAAVRK